MIFKSSKRYFQATTEDIDHFDNWKQVQKPLPSYLLSSKEYCLDADSKRKEEDRYKLWSGRTFQRNFMSRVERLHRGNYGKLVLTGNPHPSI